MSWQCWRQVFSHHLGRLRHPPAGASFLAALATRYHALQVCITESDY